MPATHAQETNCTESCASRLIQEACTCVGQSCRHTSTFCYELLALGLYRIYFFLIRPEPDFTGFGMTNPAGARAGFSNGLQFY